MRAMGDQAARIPDERTSKLGRSISQERSLGVRYGYRNAAVFMQSHHPVRRTE